VKIDFFSLIGLSLYKVIDLRQTKTKMIAGPFYAYRSIYFIGENASFFVLICNE